MSELNELKSKAIKFPTPDHPIAIERNPNRVVISVAGRDIADWRRAISFLQHPPARMGMKVHRHELEARRLAAGDSYEKNCPPRTRTTGAGASG
jgi:hypothetical protein